MPNKTKITEEISKQILELANSGHNTRAISTQLSLARGTIKTFLQKNNIEPVKRLSIRTVELEPKILEMLKQGFSKKQISKTLKAHHTLVVSVADANGIQHRSRKESALDKVLTDAEATAKLPTGSGKAIGYVQSKNKYAIQAEDGFVYYKSSGKLFQGDPRGKGGAKLEIDNVISQLNSLGYEYVSGFERKRDPLNAIHRKCGKQRTNRLRNFYVQQCPSCSNTGISKAELEVLEWVKSFYPSAHKFKLPGNITKNKEIDIYIPELKLGIEYCGLYWHTEDLEEAKDSKHYKKMLIANQEGIRLITIFENEWINRQEQVKGFLMSAMKQNKIKIHARDCEMRYISDTTGNAFFDEHHIQGSHTINPFAVFGLFYKNELIGAMDLGGHPQGKTQDGDVYLNRLAFKVGVSVAGGSSRLFKEAKRFASGVGNKRIVSWSDNRWSEGAVYKALGFEFDSQKKKNRGLMDGSIWPDFFYVVTGKIYTRRTIKSFKDADLEEIPRIYDCGKKRWIFNLEP